MFTALAAMFLVLSSLVPTGSAILLAMSSAMICGMVCECGTKYALIGFTVAAVIASMLSADKTVPAMFIIFAGWYPIAKLHIERIHKRRIEVFIKLIIAALVSAAATLFSRLFGIPFEWYWILLCAAAVIGYDYILDIMIRIYYTKIRKHIK